MKTADLQPPTRATTARGVGYGGRPPGTKEKCTSCKGEGMVAGHRCAKCDGTGMQKPDKAMERMR